MLATTDLFRTGNTIEAGLWIAIGLAFLAAATLRRGPARRLCAASAIVFVLFGVSDIVEARTGAWWRPWWLFAWKALCVLAMLVLLRVCLKQEP